MSPAPSRVVHGRPSERGFSILEVLISSVIFLIGFAGLAAMHTYAAGFDMSAQRVDQATSIARDLLSYLETVPFSASGARTTVLTDPNTGNDTADDMRDVTGIFAQTNVPASAYDHDEADLVNVDISGGTNPCAAMTTPTVDCRFQGYADHAVIAGGRPTLDIFHNGHNAFDRYWLIEDQTDGTGQIQGVLISVVVRWRTTTGTYRRVVLTGYRANPALMTKMN